MSEPTLSRTGFAFIHNTVEQWRQLGITHDDKTDERYWHATIKNFLEQYNGVLRIRRERQRAQAKKT